MYLGIGSGSQPALRTVRTRPRQGDVLIASSSHFQATAQCGPGWGRRAAGFLVLFLLPRAILIPGCSETPCL